MGSLLRDVGLGLSEGWGIVGGRDKSCVASQWSFDEFWSLSFKKEFINHAVKAPWALLWPAFLICGERGEHFQGNWHNLEALAQMQGSSECLILYLPKFCSQDKSYPQFPPEQPWLY